MVTQRVHLPDDETWIRSELLCRRFLTNVGERLLMNMGFKMMQRAISLQKKTHRS